MNTLFEKLKRSFKYYYYGQKNEWHFPSNIAHLSGGKMANGSYEPDVSKKIVEILESGDTFIDVGANVGYFSKIASKKVGPKGKIYAFEVELENYYALTKNINGHSNINALHLAISNDNSFVKVNHSSHSNCHSIVDTDNLLDGKKFSIPTITLDHFWETYLQKRPIQLIKIDVEGAELMVLEGMDHLLTENIINTIIIEFCPRIIQNAGYNIAGLYEKIATNYTISIIDKEYKSIIENGIIKSIADLEAVTNQLLKKEDTININWLCNKV
ncbi:MAG TPA: FkbM family methyltransferase [Bacteroidales bacterium]|nr:FkbM family methyltransferase [Balneolales bacterium]HYX05560.1 FkbM family methyltransferase [Bacteroidales bacterium]